MSKGIVILSKIKSVYTGHIYSVQDAAKEIENGMVGHKGDLVTGEREVYEFVQPTTASIAEQALILMANPEVNYEEYKRTDASMLNYALPTGEVGRAYEVDRDDVFEVSNDMVDAIGAEVVEGNFVVMQNGSNLLKEVAAPAGTEVFVGKITGKRNIGTLTYAGQAGGAAGIGNVIELVEIEVIKNR